MSHVATGHLDVTARRNVAWLLGDRSLAVTSDPPAK
jgi:hypothetical protein